MAYKNTPFPKQYTILSNKWGAVQSLKLFFMPVVGVEPTRVIRTRDFEFSGGFSIWCHLVIFKVIWCPTLKRKNNSTSNNFLINLRFFVAFPLGSDFSIWNAKKEIGGMFRRDAGQNAPLLRHKTKGKSRIMNQNQAKEYYEKLFVNYPDVLSVEEATTLLGFKSQTAIIRRIHQHRIRCLKVGRSFMIPKEYLIDYLLDS
ncbi:helix-turn-helix domain-containing protein [Faecalibacterium sp. OF04-11AC]|nr:helix-turn-helix domain-containing protein [Faecalibacterium sp. OF04-11AC]